MTVLRSLVHVGLTGSRWLLPWMSLLLASAAMTYAMIGALNGWWATPTGGPPSLSRRLLPKIVTPTPWLTSRPYGIFVALAPRSLARTTTACSTKEHRRSMWTGCRRPSSVRADFKRQGDRRCFLLSAALVHPADRLAHHDRLIGVRVLAPGAHGVIHRRERRLIGPALLQHGLDGDRRAVVRDVSSAQLRVASAVPWQPADAEPAVRTNPASRSSRR